MPGKPIHTERDLYLWEINEARLVFGNQLCYELVRVHENATWSNIPRHLSLKLRRQPYKEVLNAITLGNHLYFPTQLPTELIRPGHPDYHKLPWLIHELAHAWQYQHIGWGYLLSAVKSQIRLGTGAYNFGGIDGLHASSQLGLRLSDYNLEQQAGILSSYYTHLVQEADVTAWMPFIQEFQEQI